ncbi:enolase-phosphatase E1 isoform X1 [Chrysoperla carnea]|uniref:enolase-phosphatase E1 isoform X1 n=1 Tax=Chrysoperla carnea TaxID=189513 RepID=UPI001D05DB20|nr:enolase-phosphatase E1 isoform X1 [Chrysoperla carnea]
MSSINDYPEHLNPFYEDDNHNRIRFWTKTKKLVRSNSFSLSGFNDGFKGLRNSIRRSVSRSRRNSTTTSKESSPVMLRRQLSPQDNTSTPEYGYRTERIRDEYGFVVPYTEQHKYMYKTSITPTPKTKFNSTGGGDDYFSLPIRSSRYRFQPEASSTPRKATSVCDHRSSQQPYALPGLATGTAPSTPRKTSISSLNPFEEDDDNDLDGSKLSPALKRTSRNSTLRRKKRRAPLPPSANQSLNDSGIQVLDVTDPVFNTSLEITENDLTSAQKADSEEKSTVPENNSQQIELISSQIEKLCQDTLKEVAQEDINGNTETIVENHVKIHEESIENQPKINTETSDGEKTEEINGKVEVNLTVTEKSIEINGNEVEEIEVVVEEKSVEINGNQIEETEVIEKKTPIEINGNEIEETEIVVNEKPVEINGNEELKTVENQIKADENSNEKSSEVNGNNDEQDKKLELEEVVNEENIVKENGLEIIESKVDKYIDDSTVISTPQCPVKIIISTHDDQASPKLSVKDIVRNLDERSRKESLKQEEKLFIDEKHLAKEEVFIEDTETNNNFENDIPTPVPRVKKSGTTTPVNGDNHKIDLTTPNPIPKPKRSKLFSKLTSWSLKN